MFGRFKTYLNRNRSFWQMLKTITKGTSGKKFVSSLTGKKVEWIIALKYQAKDFYRNGAVAASK